jgi:hypothetical protein
VPASRILIASANKTAERAFCEIVARRPFCFRDEVVASPGLTTLTLHSECRAAGDGKHPMNDGFAPNTIRLSQYVDSQDSGGTSGAAPRNRAWGWRQRPLTGNRWPEQ